MALPREITLLDGTRLHDPRHGIAQPEHYGAVGLIEGQRGAQRLINCGQLLLIPQDDILLTEIAPIEVLDQLTDIDTLFGQQRRSCRMRVGLFRLRTIGIEYGKGQRQLLARLLEGLRRVFPGLFVFRTLDSGFRLLHRAFL